MERLSSVTYCLEMTFSVVMFSSMNYILHFRTDWLSESKIIYG